MSACDATPSDTTFAFLFTGSGITHESWGNFYPVCVKDCFYTPKQFYYMNSGVETCDYFPKAGYYQVTASNLLSDTACALYKADDRRCASSTCANLNTAKSFDPYGTTGSSTLLAAQNTHLQRNDPECVPSCQGLSPSKLTYTDSNSDVSCTTSCPPSVRIPSGSHLSVQDGTNCQNTCTTAATPVFELQGTNKMCITSCRDSVQTTPNHFQTTTPTGYSPAGHSYCVSDCLSSNGLGYTYFKAVGTQGDGLITCISACGATGSTSNIFKLLHSAETDSSAKTIESTGANFNLPATLKSRLGSLTAT